MVGVGVLPMLYSLLVRFSPWKKTSKPFGQRLRNRGAQDEHGAQRKQVLVVVELVALGASLDRHQNSWAPPTCPGR